MANQNAAEAPHFTKELLAGSLKHLREDLEASLSGEAEDDRARSRLEGARRLGLHEIAKEAIPIMKQAEQDVHNLVWPGGLDSRYLALAGVIETLADLSTQLLPHDDKHAHVTDLVDVISRVRLASGSQVRSRVAESVRGSCVQIDAGPGMEKALERALAEGATAIRLVQRDIDDSAYADSAKRAVAASAAAGAPIILDGRPDIARATNAHGIVLKPGDVPPSDARKALNPWQLIGVREGSPDNAAADFVVETTNSALLGT